MLNILKMTNSGCESAPQSLCKAVMHGLEFSVLWFKAILVGFFLKFFTFFTILIVFTICAVSDSDLKYSMFNICEISSQLSILQTDKHVCPKCFFVFIFSHWRFESKSIYSRSYVFFYFHFILCFIYFSVFHIFYLICSTNITIMYLHRI